MSQRDIDLVPPEKPKRETVRLPAKEFLYYLDQVEHLLNLSNSMMKRYVHFANRTPGKPRPDKILALNIAPIGEAPAWRVPESDLVRWMKYNSFQHMPDGTYFSRELRNPRNQKEEKE